MLEVNFNPFPALATGRLLLRRLEPGDMQELFILRSDERVMQYVDRPRAKTPDDVTEFIKMIHELETNNQSILWGICLLPAKTIIGTICIWNMDVVNYRGEVGYVLLPDYFGKGIMHEAMQAVLKYGFDQLGLHSVEAHVNPHNTASIKLLERNGFVREAYFKENYFFEGKFKDTAVYSLLADNKI